MYGYEFSREDGVKLQTIKLLPGASSFMIFEPNTNLIRACAIELLLTRDTERVYLPNTETSYRQTTSETMIVNRSSAKSLK